METAEKTTALGDNGGAVSVSPPPTCSAWMHGDGRMWKCGKPAPWYHGDVGAHYCDEHGPEFWGRLFTPTWTHTPNSAGQTPAAHKETP